VLEAIELGRKVVAVVQALELVLILELEVELGPEMEPEPERELGGWILILILSPSLLPTMSLAAEPERGLGVVVGGGVVAAFKLLEGLLLLFVILFGIIFVILFVVLLVAGVCCEFVGNEVEVCSSSYSGGLDVGVVSSGKDSSALLLLTSSTFHSFRLAGSSVLYS